MSKCQVCQLRDATVCIVRDVDLHTTTGTWRCFGVELHVCQRCLTIRELDHEPKDEKRETSRMKEMIV